MSTLHRSQVYIEEGQMRLLKLEAKKEDLPVSVLIRKAIEYFLDKKAKNINWDNDPLTKAIGTIRLDVTDASTNHDFYLYGKPKSR